MSYIKCDVCQSSDIIKQNGEFMCRKCGCKYSQSEMKKLAEKNGVKSIFDSDISWNAKDTHTNSKTKSKKNFYLIALAIIAVVLLSVVLILSASKFFKKITDTYHDSDIFHKHTDSTPDLIIGYIATPFVNEEDFENNKVKFEHLLHDANDDGKKFAQLTAYTVDKQDDINDLFVDMIDSESYHIYILPKEAFVAYKDKSKFASVSANATNIETLKDESGRIYAFSIEGNSYIESLGFINTDNLFIAAANFGDEELSTEEKNGINITKEIIEKRKD